MTEQKKPPFKFDPNVPVKIKLLYDKPKEGTSKGSDGEDFDWVMYGAEIDGENRIFYALPQLDKELRAFAKGAEIIVEMKVNNKDGKKWTTWSANQVVFDNEGNQTKEKAEIVQEKINNRADRMALCLKDAYVALLAVPELTDIRKDPDAPAFSIEDVRNLAVTMYIEEGKLR